MISFHNLLYEALKIKRLFSSRILKNHYDTLNLPRNCSAKEIKDSFIKLSKEHHPDLNKNRNAHNNFLEINEAYKVLSNTKSRINYDLGLVPSTNTTNINYKEQSGVDPWKDPIFYHNRDKSQDDYYKHKSYYGIKGVDKTSNVTVLFTCLCLATFAVGLQFLAIKKSFTFQRDDLIEKSNKAQYSLKQVRETAEINGNQVQIELLKMKFAGKEKSE